MVSTPEVTITELVCIDISEDGYVTLLTAEDLLKEDLSVNSRELI